MSSRYAGAVLIGGSSTRMGADKATLDFNGSPLVDAPVAALRHGSMVALVGGHSIMHDDAEVTWVADEHPGSGPLGGLISALRWSTEEVTVVLACDLPFIDIDAVERLVSAIGTADGCVPLVDGRKQWLAAAWNRSALPILLHSYEDGERSLRRCISELSVAWLLDSRPERFVDVDTPADVEVALAATRSAERATLCP